MTLARAGRWHVAACAVLLAVAVLRWHGPLFDTELATDESDYMRAFSAVTEGRDPYTIERFFYPPPFALAGAVLVARLGVHGTALLLRAANLLGAVALVWIGLGWSRGSWRARLLSGSALIALWAPVVQSVSYGNVSLAVIGGVLVAFACLPEWPLAAGALLGVGLAVKPLGPAIVALLPAWRPLAPSAAQALAARARWLVPATALAVLGLALLWGRDFLPRMLARSTGAAPIENSLSLGRLLRELGVAVPPVVLLGLAIAAGVAVLVRRPHTTAELAVVAGTAAIYSLPIVWTHTLALTLPAQVLAFDHAVATYRAATPRSPARRTSARDLVGLAALALAVQGSTALAALDSGRPLPRILCLLPAVAAPALFAWVALRPTADRPGASGIGPTVGQSAQKLPR